MMYLTVLSISKEMCYIHICIPNRVGSLDFWIGSKSRFSGSRFDVQYERKRGVKEAVYTETQMLEWVYTVVEVC